MDELCRGCERNPENGRPPSPYFCYLLTLRRMRLAGYPFGKMDLPLSVWLDLGELEEAIEANRPRIF